MGKHTKTFFGTKYYIFYFKILFNGTYKHFNFSLNRPPY